MSDSVRGQTGLSTRRKRRALGQAGLSLSSKFLLFLSLVAAASYAVDRYRQSQPAAILPSAPARQGDFLVLIRCRGELKAERSVQISAPMVPNLRIAWMTPPGATVKQGDTDRKSVV